MGLTIRALKEAEDFVDSSYHGFNSVRERFFDYVRTKVYKELETLDKYEGFDMPSFISYKELPSFIPFYELINHSDCDGELTFSDCLNLEEDFKEHGEKLLLFIKESNESDESKEFMVEWIEMFESMVNDVAREKYHSLIFV